MKIDFEGLQLDFADFDTVRALVGFVRLLKDEHVERDFPFFDEIEKAED